MFCKVRVMIGNAAGQQPPMSSADDVRVKAHTVVDDSRVKADAVIDDAKTAVHHATTRKITVQNVVDDVRIKGT